VDRSRVAQIVFQTLVALFANNASAVFAARFINFDDIDTRFAFGNVVGLSRVAFVPGDHYASQGVLFSTGKISTDYFSVGDQLSFSKLHDLFIVARNFNSVSAPNFLAPDPPSPGFTFNDLLLTFTTPVTSVAINSDHAVAEYSADPIRLLALEPSQEPNGFKVLALDEKYDDATSSPADLLSIDLGGRPFSYALIEVVSELEGFDNLTFTQVPEPSTAALLVIGCVVALVGRRRSASSRPCKFLALESSPRPTMIGWSVAG
jgi:hypothetical protein